MDQLTESCTNKIVNLFLNAFVHYYQSPFDFCSNQLNLNVIQTSPSSSLLDQSDNLQIKIYYVNWRRFLLAAAQPAITYYGSSKFNYSSLVQLAQQLLELSQHVDDKLENLLNTRISWAQFQFVKFEWFPHHQSNVSLI